MTPRGLDHLVIAVADLDAAGAFYEALGFQVGARNRHPWGTHNRIIQIGSAFLELVTVAEPDLIPPHALRAFSFGAFVRDSLARGEGPAMLVLTSRDAQVDADTFKAAGIGDFEPFHFERVGTGPDGTPRNVAFTLAFAVDEAAPLVGFFTCQHHRPENFWSAERQVHPNGAVSVRSVAMVAENPSDHHVFLTAFSGQRDLQSNSLGINAHLANSRVDILTPIAATQIYGSTPAAIPALIGLTVAVRDLSVIATRLKAASIPAERRQSSIVVPAGAALGTGLVFIEA